jgi:hypothetical protein
LFGTNGPTAEYTGELLHLGNACTIALLAAGVLAELSGADCYYFRNEVEEDEDEDDDDDEDDDEEDDDDDDDDEDGGGDVTFFNGSDERFSVYERFSEFGW